MGDVFEIQLQFGGHNFIDIGLFGVVGLFQE
jgi:hypothetical protein